MPTRTGRPRQEWPNIALFAGRIVPSALLAFLLVACGSAAGGSAAPAGSSATIPDCSDNPPYRAGTHLMTPAQSLLPFPIAITVTDGWTGCGLHFKELGEPGGVMMIGTWTVANVYANPCRWRTSLHTSPTGPTVDDLIRALSDQDGTDAAKASDITIDHYEGRFVHFEVPPDLDTSGCEKDPQVPDANQLAEFRFWDGPGDAVWWLGAADAPGLVGEVWVLDVEGTRVAIQTASFADAGETRRAEMREIVQSIDFMP